MTKKALWRKPLTVLHAARRLGSMAAAAGSRRGKRQRPAPSELAPRQTDVLAPALPVGRKNGAQRWFNLRFIALTLALALLAVTLVAGGLLVQELRSARWQADFFSERAAKMTSTVQAGPSPVEAIRYPRDSPYDERLGYSRLPEYLSKLQGTGFQITAQARMSADMLQAIDQGLYAPYREKTQLGLAVLDCRKQPLFAARYPERTYASFEELPLLLVKSLLFIENRELLDDRYPTRNPAVDWVRLSKAALEQALHGFDPERKSPGGSTLATQIEKYRHSPEGRTASSTEKLRQMASASLRAYQGGPDTTATRHRLVVDYLNTVPLSAKPGFGEVNGIGDGLWVWYGRDFAQINALLRSAPTSTDPNPAAALAYKQALSLLIAQRRPSYYLGDGTSDLEALTNSHLRVLAKEGVIPTALRDVALTLRLVGDQPARAATQPVSFVARKASTALRSQLASVLGSAGFYGLDRLDLSVTSTLDGQGQAAVTQLLRQLRDSEAAAAAGLQGKGLLGHGDPAKVVYSVTLLERGEQMNYLRLQTDNFDQPLDINDGAKLDLGSTAKLRTLVSYLDIIANLHQRHGALDAGQLKEIELDPKDTLSRWGLDYLLQHPDGDLATMLQAALERRYSANPAESFFTGGGLHTFSNFQREDNNRTLSVREGLRNSVNLVFVRLMRDVVHHYMFQAPGSSATLLNDSKNPRRAEYLSRFADREGREFIHRFFTKYQGKSAAQAQELLMQSVRVTPARLASLYRTIAPEATLQSFTAFVEEHLDSEREVDADRLARLYEQYSPQSASLADRGFVATVHPLELWVVGYLRSHPGATPAQVIAASSAERQAVYHWLFSTSRKHAQDSRILSLLEVEGFLEIHRQWKRMGYPFDALVPSYASALGASADRPSALAELMGILVNEGVRKPVQRIQALHFAADTPYETVLQHQASKSERVLAPEVARAVLGVIREVVDEGTAKRARKAFVLADGTELAVGGKTGTGDHRFDVYGANGQLLRSRVVNRSATFVFNIGERYFGSITAHVRGPQAADYDFTSALPVQLLKVLASRLMPLLEPAADHMANGGHCGG
jgi:membrane peptidoglycan carboxypeptidase